MKKKIWVPAAVLFILCVVATALVAFANAVTKEPIAENQKAAAQATMQKLIPGAEFTLLSGDFGENVTAYEAKKDGVTVGYLFNTLGEGGYGGALPVTTALSPEGKVLGVEVDVSSETPGLGQNAAKGSFLDQFKSGASRFILNKDKTTETEGVIDALSGASKSSRAVTNGVNAAKEAFVKVYGDGNE